MYRRLDGSGDEMMGLVSLISYWWEAPTSIYSLLGSSVNYQYRKIKIIINDTIVEVLFCCVVRQSGTNFHALCYSYL